MGAKEEVALRAEHGTVKRVEEEANGVTPRLENSVSMAENLGVC